MADKKKDNSDLVAKLKRMLRDGVVEFKYEKVDGSIRKARGTLKPSLLPEEDKEDKRKRKTSDMCVVYYDLDKDDWRQCRKENIISVKDKK